VRKKSTKLYVKFDHLKDFNEFSILNNDFENLIDSNFKNNKSTLNQIEKYSERIGVTTETIPQF
jgi:hypothetical protein